MSNIVQFDLTYSTPSFWFLNCHLLNDGRIEAGRVNGIHCNPPELEDINYSRNHNKEKCISDTMKWFLNYLGFKKQVLDT